MEGLKILVSGAALALLVAAVALANARVAGENFVSPQTDDPSATLSEALGATHFESSLEGDVGESDVDVNVSSSVDIDFSSSVDIDISGEGSATSDQGEQDEDGAVPPPAGEVNGQVFSCPEGERTEWENDSTEIECRNRNGRINLDFESEGDSSIKFHFKYP